MAFTSKTLTPGTQLHYIWTDGAFAGGEYKATLLTDGKLKWEGIAGEEAGKSAIEKSYTVSDISDGVGFLTWLEEQTYTLTLIVDTNTKTVTGVASNSEEHYPLKGDLLAISAGS